MDYAKTIKSIDNLGRILIPKNLRKQAGLETYDELEMFVENGRIILEKKTKRCMICSSEDEVLDLGENRYICKKCKLEIAQIENE